jgi:hypothetical protein
MSLPARNAIWVICRASLYFSLLLALFSLSLFNLARAETNPLPWKDYWMLVEETSQAVKSAQALPADQAHALLDPLAERWQSFDRVSLPDSQAVQVDNSYLLSQLRLTPPDPARLEKLLGALLALRSTAPAASFSEGDIQTIQDILARPEFQWRQNQPSLWQQWMERIRERFLQWMASWLSKIGLGGSLSVLPYFLTAAGLLVVFLVLIYALRNIVSGIVAESELAVGEEGEEGALTAGIALQKAQASSSLGDYRTAVRYLYLSSLLQLEERGLLPYDRSRTNREYLRSLSRLPLLAAILRDVVDVFDRVWYGYQPMDEDSYNRFARRVEELQQQK